MQIPPDDNKYTTENTFNMRSHFAHYLPEMVISKAEPRHPPEDAYFGHFGHYQKLMSIGGGLQCRTTGKLRTWPSGSVPF